MLRRSFFVAIILLVTCLDVCGQSNNEADEYEYDTTNVNVFEGADSCSFKLDYYHTEGISTGDRYWYEIIILDSLVILNFKSPDSDTWNYISYQKRMVISDSVLSKLKRSIKTHGIKQKIKGIPKWQGSGYGADRLFIETKDVHIAGGTVFMVIGDDSDINAYNRRIKLEKQQSSSISGDFQKFFKDVERLFTGLPVLLKECERE